MPLQYWLHRFIACLLALSHLAVAASAGGGEDAYFEPLPVVLTVSRLPQPVQDTPGAVTVIDEDLIRATGYRDVARLLRLVPGMQVGQERGNEQWVTYHGLAGDYANQMQVLVDGRSVYSPDFFGGADWGALALTPEDIERIEVVRGSNSAAYGANAFLGVVNILTRHTAAESGSSVSARLGTHGIADVSGRAVARSGDLGLRLSARQLSDDGFNAIPDDRRTGVLDLRSDLRLGTMDELRLSAGLSHGHRERGYPGTPYNVLGVRDAQHDDSYTHLRWVHAPGPDEELALSWYRNREHSDEMWYGEGELPPYGFLRVPVIRDRSSLRDNIALQHHFGAAPGLRVLWGLEWRRDRLDAPILFFSRKTRQQREGRLFANLEWRAAPAWLWNLGVMAERFDDEKTRLAPRIFLNWNPSPGRTWRVGYSRAYRHPTLFERHADVRILLPGTNVPLYRQFIANPDIDSQTVDAFELGFLRTLAGSRASIDVRLFHERVSDLIRRRAATPDSLTPIEATLPPTSWENYSHPVTLTGLEYQLRTTPWQDGEILLSHSMIATHAADRAIERTVAPYTASLTWQQRAGRWQSAVTVLRMGSIDAGSGLVPGYRYTVPAYTSLDASIACNVRVDGRPVELRLSGINLLGRHQELAPRLLQAASPAGEPVTEVGPQVYAGIRVQF